MSWHDDLSESLKGMKDYLVKADQFKKVDPVVSVYCKVQHVHWPCFGQRFSQLASRDSPLAWREVSVVRGAE